MIGTGNNIGTDHRQYAQGGTILRRTYSYKNGKGQEEEYYAKDALEITRSFSKISPDVDNYEEIKRMLKNNLINGGKIDYLGSKYKSEISEIMSDYYSGKINRDEVKNIFKEYFYHAFGNAAANQNYIKHSATSFLAGLYELFSEANASNAYVKNMEEGEALMESHGLTWNGTYYYNADWYYACEEMQEMFRETANDLADEVGAEHVDFEYVEKNTRFKLTGGITFNGIWDCIKWQSNCDRGINSRFLNKDMAPPKGFVYCATYWNEKVDLYKGKDHSFMLFLLAAAKNTDEKDSLLFSDQKYSHSSKWEKNDTYRSAMAFLKNFNIQWNRRCDRMEFLYVQ